MGDEIEALAESIANLAAFAMLVYVAYKIEALAKSIAKIRQTQKDHLNLMEKISKILVYHLKNLKEQNDAK